MNTVFPCFIIQVTWYVDGQVNFQRPFTKLQIHWDLIAFIVSVMWDGIMEVPTFSDMFIVISI